MPSFNMKQILNPLRRAKISKQKTRKPPAIYVLNAQKYDVIELSIS